jgi:alpha-N-arabinofuranosidase
MANNTEFGGTLGEALDWIEYVNGNADSTNFGKIRAFFGNHEPYQVLYWGIGNENYGPWGKHTAETAFGYAERLGLWAKTINSKFPGLHLLGVGHTAEWNKIVLEKAGTEIDYLTQHYYINSKFKDHEIENPFNSLFAPVLVEKHLSLLGDYLTYFNNQNRKTKRPVKLSIDEWNNRHSVYDGKEYKFSRNDPRRLIDATIAASMLNVFIRKSDIVGMANYIFPVNGHGLIRTIGDNGAIITPLFYVFKKYRETMNGQKLNTTVNGSGISALQIKPSIEGDCKEVLWGEEHLNFIDAAASLNKDGKIHVALINRSYNQKQSVSVKLPGDYKFQNRWILSGKNFNEFNNVGQEKSIAPKINSDGKKTKNGVNIIMEPCAVEILSFTPLWFN